MIAPATRRLRVGSSRGAALLLALAVVAGLYVLAVAYFDLLWSTRSWDAHVLLHNAERIVEVGGPYYEAGAEQKGPLWTSLYVLAYAVGGPFNAWFLVAAMVVGVAVSTGVVVGLVGRWFGASWALVAGIACAVAIHLTLGGEEYSWTLYSRTIVALLEATCFLLLLRLAVTASPRSQLRLAVVAGAVGGLAVQTNLGSAPAGAVMGLFVAWLGWFGPLRAGRRVLGIPLILLAFGASAIAMLVSVIAFYAVRGGLEDFIDLWWSYNRNYTAAADLTMAETLEKGVRDFWAYYQAHPFLALIVAGFLADTTHRAVTLRATASASPYAAPTSAHDASALPASSALDATAPAATSAVDATAPTSAFDATGPQDGAPTPGPAAWPPPGPPSPRTSLAPAHRLAPAHLLAVHGFVVLWWLAACLAVTLSQRFFPHYLALPFVPVAVMGAILAAHHIPRLRPDVRALAPAAIAIGVLCVSSAPRFDHGVERLADFESPSQYHAATVAALSPQRQELRKVVHDNSPPGSYVYIWSNEPWAYTDVERRSPTRYVEQRWLIGEIYGGTKPNPDYVPKNAWTKWTADMRSTPPVLWIELDPWSPPPGSPAQKLRDCAFTPLYAAPGQRVLRRTTTPIERCLTAS